MIFSFIKRIQQKKEKKKERERERERKTDREVAFGIIVQRTIIRACARLSSSG